MLHVRRYSETLIALDLYVMFERGFEVMKNVEIYLKGSQTSSKKNWFLHAMLDKIDQSKEIK